MNDQGAWAGLKTAVAHDPSASRILAALTDAARSPDWAELAEYIDESDYSAADWMEALGHFHEWLVKKGDDSCPLGAMAGYVSCCTQINPETIPLASLKIIVSQCLIEFGFDKISDPQN